QPLIGCLPLKGSNEFDESAKEYELGRILSGGVAGPSFGLAHLEASRGNLLDARLPSRSPETGCDSERSAISRVSWEGRAGSGLSIRPSAATFPWNVVRAKQPALLLR